MIHKLFMFALFVLSIIAVIDCLKSKKGKGDKAIWIAIVVLLQPVVGVLLYYFIGKKQK